MKLITAEELIAAPNGTVFTTENDYLLIKDVVFEDNTLQCTNLSTNRSCLLSVNNECEYKIYDDNDIRTTITLLQESLNS